MGLKRALKDTLKDRGLRRLLEIGQRFGVNLTPNHYYSEIPDLHELRRDTAWRRPRSMAHVEGSDLDEQLTWVARWCGGSDGRRAPGAIYDHAVRANGEPGFGFVEAAVLYGFVRRERPQRVVQVGAGVSTAVLLLAAEEEGIAPVVTCIDPHPTAYLRSLEQSGRIRLLARKAQSVDTDVIARVGPGGLLFVDSTHTVKPGSEVNRIVLEILPRLEAGAWVHFHDIRFPYDYSTAVLTRELFFSHESVLLHAFLTCNPRYRLATSLSMLHHARADALRELIPGYRPRSMRDGLELSPDGHFPSSAYLLAL